MNWQPDAWGYVFIAIAGFLATDIWRWLGVVAGRRLREDSEVLNWVRAVATALVAGVVSKLIVFPTGVLESSPLWLRVGSIAVGALAFFLGRQVPAIGIAAAIAFLGAGLYLLGF
ncbi:branched-subunit amino acid transport protein AzlD [Rhizobium sp. PP-WC-2G-219]|uniref:AzlD domain-containing protein n=1 Tax=Ferranicluibacter rubi TaxID=2715133 RepID=A0AA43ZIU9_9HYPH|nr:AzlD domain-containing protein [Ferranicluibacter rubi]NHT78700.1 AzlD domain-containing protein [Ferranicluibacter rubi]PYE27128.1 branched-subunit amino acid transport protein AzlD [Rhizobium sp. PP-CC-3A-592]PYE44759.1 branched-subunit amino acid transport protein AzlD [Rhizobium sp. PP-F2F-G20b]TCL94078.1 branched-subunit amino acid transport protein AzlD [Rhizobium sp. PP-WC-2G-219]